MNAFQRQQDHETGKADIGLFQDHVCRAPRDNASKRPRSSAVRMESLPIWTSVQMVLMDGSHTLACLFSKYYLIMSPDVSPE